MRVCVCVSHLSCPLPPPPFDSYTYNRNVSVEHRWLNEVLGRVCSVPFQGCFPAFRHLHLEHHKYTNDPLKDP